LVCVPSATADNSREWTVGDLISVGLVCKDEKSILEIVHADVKSEELVLMTMSQSIMMGVCISFEGSMRFLVQRALVHYKDHAGRASVVLGVGNADQDSLGWVLATGKFVSEKKSEETSI
tara:strand:- start:68 stop:427 length:360 start_codon:yes stop_codon:yes gene_type:complete